MPELDARVISKSATNWVAFSGGPDSVCLLHLLTATCSGWRIRAVHVDHGLDDQSRARARRAIEIAGLMGLDCRLERLGAVPLSGQGGPEAAARHARYASFQALMQTGDHVLTAHHADDQVETVMLRLLRGAGPDGLCGMRPIRRLGSGWLGRPLLDWTRAEVLKYLRCHQLDWLEDPTNLDLSLDRNYLRHRVLPEIERRWPGYRSSVVQSSRWQDAAARALAEDAVRNLDRLATISVSKFRHNSGETTLDMAGWLALKPEQALAVIRAWCSQARIDTPATRPLREFRAQCASARADRQPALDWPAACLRAWRGRVWLERKPEVPEAWALEWPSGHQCPLPAGGSLVWSGTQRCNIGKHWLLAAPQPGARLRLHRDGPKKEVMALMRDANVPPWRRHAFPALTIDGRLCTVGVEWMDVEFKQQLSRTGSHLEWQQRPAALLP